MIARVLHCHANPFSPPYRRHASTVSLHCCLLARGLCTALLVVTPQTEPPLSHCRTTSERTTMQFVCMMTTHGHARAALVGLGH
jgi:hypothetical protein